MIWILLALLAGIAWAIWFILQLDLWIPLVVTGVVGLVALVVFINNTIRSRRSAAALERAIAEQGRLQAMNARPEKRAEIQALQKQILDGIQAVKKSKLGGKGGGGALYALPWYAIIGPPGAGKTTALKHSGLVFPYADTSIRGVGGTRNCDWWFTNEAILLDTAGRYATEQEDQQEWLSFLRMLLKYRGHKPLNGLIVAVAIPDIIDATEQQIEAMGKKLRARIDEVMTQLRMVLPVYLLVTKCDLIAGFVEYYGNLRKSERAQAWGATFNLREPKADPGSVFQREFDQLVERVHSRAVKRLAGERNRQARERIFQFPLEFAGIRRNLSDLVSTIFMVNPFQGTPLFRGFYFSSGTQEGRPLDRVLGRMGQAMGINPVLYQQQQPAVESKSYFLHDVFMRVVFPDADVAARSASEVRRQQLVRLGVSVAALSCAAILAIPCTISFFNNRALLKGTEQIAKQATGITWGDSRPVSEKLNALQPALKRLQELDEHEAEGVPFGLRFLMYQGEKLYRPTVRVFVSNMQQGFVKPCKYKLESQLKGITGDKYLQERRALKTYLMLSDVDNLDVEWATGQYVSLWAELHEQTSDVALVELKRQMQPFVKYYLDLLAAKKVTPVAPNDAIVKKARDTLQAVPVRKRYYAQFVEDIGEEKYDPQGDNSRSNRKYPPLRLDDMFKDRPEVTKVLTSKQFKAKNVWFEVEGPYTDKGHYAVLANIEKAVDILEAEAWVVPLTPEERGDRVAVNVAKLAEDYEQRYIQVWKDFLMDLNVEPPATVKEAIDVFAELRKPEWPLLRVLRTVEDHTQWKKALESVEQNSLLTRTLNRKLNTYVSSKTKGLRWDIDVRKIAGRASVVPATFKKAVAFGVPQDTSATPGATPLAETGLAQYMEMLGTLREKMVAAEDKEPGIGVQVVALDLQNAMKQVDALLQPADDMARTTLQPLLMNPLNVGGKIPKPTAPGATVLPPRR